ncbi:DEAD/DEAH box helicase [Lachnospiraceae bacterium ZAX-1]
MKNEKTNKFEKFNLSNDIIEALTLLNYLQPTKIQELVIPIALEGKDIAAKSQTGTGKTAAFAIPICELTKWEENLPQALILEPTRELAVQVRDEIFHIGRKKRLKVPAVFGGFPIDKQIQTLRQKSHIVVGTPGRIMDHIRRQSLQLNQIKYLVIDEADLMLDMGFLEEVEQIVATLPPARIIFLFSATLNETIEQLVKTYMKDVVPIAIASETETVEEVTQMIYEVSQDDKYPALLKILMKENPNDCMIFCGTREMVNVLCRKLKKDGIPCGMIHGELDQAERLRTIDGFRIGRFHYLITTDIAARGVDFENITHIINYDFPTGKETFVHRVGRTARNGKTGKAISIVARQDKKMLQMVETYIGKELAFDEFPQPDEQEEKNFWSKQKEKTALKPRKGEALGRNITRLAIGGGRKSKMRAVDIVGTICSIEHIKTEDIGIIDVRDSLTYVEILNGKGKQVLEALQNRTIKGKVRKVRITRN